MDDALKQRVLIAVIVFNIVLMILQFGFNLSDSFILKVLINLFIASIAAAATFFGMGFVKK